MTEKLIQKLRKRYPKIITCKTVIACDDGWYDLISEMCVDIQNSINAFSADQIEIVSLDKSTTGRLQVITNKNPFYIIQTLFDYEDRSLNIFPFREIPFKNSQGEIHPRLKSPAFKMGPRRRVSYFDRYTFAHRKKS